MIETAAHVLWVFTNELDWPMLSAGTAYFNSTENWEEVIQGPVDSMYLRFRERNRCNHRDYQMLIGHIKL